VTPEELFLVHKERAEALAERLCWHFQVAGTMSYLDEAKSTARVTLWTMAGRYDPSKQAYVGRKRSDAIFWNVFTDTQLFESPSGKRDPYETFWLWAQQRVRGSVLDFFRSHKLIVRGATTEHYSIPYYDRFVSIDSLVDRTDYSNRPGRISPFESPSEPSEDCEDTRRQIDELIKNAGLTEVEEQVVRMYYSRDGFDFADVAQRFSNTRAWAARTLKGAIAKLRTSAGVECACP